MKSIVLKAQKYIELNTKASKSKLTADEIQQSHQLRRELSARGLDPQHVVGLEYRALVFTYKAKVTAFVNMRTDDKRIVPTYLFLQKVGINPDQRELARLLTEFKQNAKRVDKRKTERFTELARPRFAANDDAVRLTDLTEDDFAEDDRLLDEIADELGYACYANSDDDSNDNNIDVFAADAFGV